MNVIITLYQAITNLQAIQKLKARMFGWSMESQSIIFKEADGSDYGVAKRIPSITGEGLNKTIQDQNHTFVVGDIVRINSLGNFEYALSNSNKNGTHYVFETTSTSYSVAQFGTWKTSSLVKGDVFLSKIDPGKITQTSTGVEQKIGSYDGQHLHLQMAGGFGSSEELSIGVTSNTLSITNSPLTGNGNIGIEVSAVNWSTVTNTPTSLSAYNISATDTLFDSKYITMADVPKTKLAINRALRVGMFGDSTALVNNESVGNSDMENVGSRDVYMLQTNGGYLNASKIPVVIVADCGWSGTNTANFITRGNNPYTIGRKSLSDVVAKNPDLIIFSGGSINDLTNYSASTPLSAVEETVQNHIECVKQLTRTGIPVIDWGIYGYDGPNLGLAAIRSFIVYVNNRLVEESKNYPLWTFCNTEGITHVSGAFLPLMSTDGTHLNPHGAGIIKEYTENIINERYSVIDTGKIYNDYSYLWADKIDDKPSSVTYISLDGGATMENTKVKGGVWSFDYTGNGVDGVGVYIDIANGNAYLGSVTQGDTFKIDCDIEVIYDGQHVPYMISGQLTLNDASTNSVTKIINTSNIKCITRSGMGKIPPVTLPFQVNTIGAGSRLSFRITPTVAGKVQIKMKAPIVRKHVRPFE